MGTGQTRKKVRTSERDVTSAGVSSSTTSSVDASRDGQSTVPSRNLGAWDRPVAS